MHTTVHVTLEVQQLYECYTQSNMRNDVVSSTELSSTLLLDTEINRTGRAGDRCDIGTKT